MYASTVIAFFLIHVGLLIMFPAVWMTWRGLTPKWVAESQRSFGAHPFLSGLVGLLVGGMWFMVAAGLGSTGAPILQVAAGVGYGLLVLYAMAGIAGLAGHLGSNLPSPVDNERPWKAMLRGGIGLELTWFLPFVGWFFLFPLSIVVGVGSATLGLVGLIRGAAQGGPPATHAQPHTQVESKAPAAALYA